MRDKIQRAKRVCMTENEIERKKERREKKEESEKENERKKFSAGKRETL